MKRRLTCLITVVTASLIGLGAAAPAGAAPSIALSRPALAADNPHQRGPDPTEASVTAETGPFATAKITVAGGSVQGFGGGTIYYPTSTSEGTFGAIAISPGFFEAQLAIAWLGPRLASQGFVVFTIDTNSWGDIPSSRTDQLLAALDYLTTSSQVKDRIDANRTGVMGHSMGGGGSLGATVKRPALKAAIPLAPWHTTKNWSAVTVPTLIVGADGDTVAPVDRHAEPFYTSMTSAPEKAYLELKGATHNTTNSPNTTVAKYGISWLKRFIDNDTRYDRFLCPPPAAGDAIAEYRDTCPVG